LAKKKSESRAIITTLREINKKKALKPHQVGNLKKLAQFLEKTKHRNLLGIWGLFWDDKQVYFIQEPVVRVASLTHVGPGSIL
jgi:hypothetical protein